MRLSLGHAVGFPFVKHARLDSLLLAGVGTLAVHEIAYVPGSIRASVVGGVLHSHIPLLWGVGGTLAVVALVRKSGRVVAESQR